MKHLLFISVLSVILFSCKKEIAFDSTSPSLLNTIKIQLKDSISKMAFEQLDFTNTFFTYHEKNDLTILRIPFNNKSIESDFVLLKIEKNQAFSIGKIINIRRIFPGNSLKAQSLYDGEINIYSLNGKLLIESTITGGYIDAFANKKSSAEAKDIIVVEMPLLPDVVLVSSYPSTNTGWQYSSLFNLQSMLYGTGSGGGGGTNSGGYYNNSNPLNDPASTGNPNSTEGYGGGGGSTPVYIDFEPSENLEPIDLDKYLKCFSSIPDDGAVCTITIYTDIPVDSNPQAAFNWQTNSPGHTFIKLSKQNGGKYVQQNIGFYPKAGWKIMHTPAPVEGKFVDNTDHEFNASLSMELTPEKFKSTITKMQYLARFIKYDIDEYNCTDFAMEVFNSNRGGNQLEIARYDIPGGNAPYGSNIPQGLYLKLKEMKALENSESKRITIPGVKGFVGNSNGPCN